ncbi:glycosyltransferase family A protein [Galbibacter sp. EGI 63066]|uniref:glycosyltransferase n=1 Tax=Galbibacter sp. EGI 63066 TaxID=2993559 RepID=UPI0022496CAD|nr:glycosyltransferase family A protein [Galbibacter sp. EGI 63066]MCX2678489.1 glycosyltransferase family A protein [Galbibacter sp. EGI 63066]
MTGIKYKISFCTVCMNRLYHLKETLPQNIRDNIEYSNVEFVVLNYNSRDDMDVWIKNKMKDYIDMGVLRYYRTEDPDSFHMSHAKNAVSKLATGDIICNVDADNFIRKGFADYLNDMFSEKENIYARIDKNSTQRDCFGRIAMWKDDFTRLRGYDERMKGYGFDDYDLWNRLRNLGRTPSYIKKAFLKALTHNDNERIKNEENNKGIKSIYVKHINHAVSELLYMFQGSNKYYKGTILINKLVNSKSIDNLFPENHSYEYSNDLYGDSWEIGIWSENSLSIELKSNNVNSVLKLDKTNYGLKSMLDEGLYLLSDKVHIEDMIMFFSQINNRIIMKQNTRDGVIQVNEISYGDINLLR